MSGVGTDVRPVNRNSGLTASTIVASSGCPYIHAIGQAAAALDAAGVEDWSLNAGGDVLVGGSPVPGSGTPWLAGIVDPLDRGSLLSAFPLGGGGRFERIERNRNLVVQRLESLSPLARRLAAREAVVESLPRAHHFGHR